MSLAFILGLSPEKFPELCSLRAVCVYTFIQVNDACCLATQIPLGHNQGGQFRCLQQTISQDLKTKTITYYEDKKEGLIILQKVKKYSFFLMQIPISYQTASPPFST